ncbi:MAG: pyrimidine-nucleoside phosphorylase [Anaerolineaceae bacterium]|nr:pyrimidine-nucleoside phosphorylase [Anaerolineaceae bacterium]
MRTVDIIAKKRDKKALTEAEISFLIQNYVSGNIPDYQMSAWCMAVLLNGMSHEEITDLTLAMAHSGEVLDLKQAVSIAVDKHSTGGVGDKTTLTVAPLVAACGLPVGKMSGRGLGFSGGTIDKLEAIPGIKVDLSPEMFISQLREHGVVLTGQSANLAPADGKLYALRDVTATVQSIPLIASSVMSKKIAAGADAIVLDVKVGIGAFMKTLENAKELAEVMVAIGHLSKRRVIAVLSPMDQPLGCAVGNALELREAIEMLHGNGPEDYRYHCLHLAGYMLVLGEKAKTLEEGIGMAEKAIADGRAFEKFRELVEAQHGDLSVVDDLDKLAKAQFIEPVLAESEGYVKEVNAQEVGETSVELGAGRAQKSDKIDLAVGIKVLVKVGDKVSKGQTLFEVHANDKGKQRSAIERLKGAIKYDSNPVKKPPYFYGVIGM